MPQIALAEDDLSLQQGLSEVLEDEGYQVRLFSQGDQALGAMQQTPPDLLILDIMLPKMDGIQICKQLRKDNFQFPIIMLTALASEQEIVKGLEAGADDYVVKPFRLQELLARIQAQLRRHQSKTNTSLTLGKVEIDLETGSFEKSGALHSLTSLELQLLNYLLESYPQAVSRDQLLKEVWGYKATFSTRAVDMAIAKLRSKLEEVPSQPRYILTIRERGYCLHQDIKGKSSL